MTDFKNPIPVDRTIVPGVWSDVLDEWLNRLTNGNSDLELLEVSTIVLAGELKQLHDDNLEIRKLLSAVLRGIEIISNTEDLIDHIED